MKMEEVPQEVLQSIHDKWMNILQSGFVFMRDWHSCALCDYVNKKFQCVEHCDYCPVCPEWCDHGYAHKSKICLDNGEISTKEKERWIKNVHEFLCYIKSYMKEKSIHQVDLLKCKPVDIEHMGDYIFCTNKARGESILMYGETDNEYFVGPAYLRHLLGQVKLIIDCNMYGVYYQKKKA